jgi:hypothetical protein
MDHQMNPRQHYIRFAIMIGLSFVAMYIFMYAMVDMFSNVFPNINQFYMAGLMTAPMVVFELLLMGMMYPNKKLNIGIIGLSIVALIFFWVGVRQQIGIGDEQFLKSMIPHHAGAILMCEQAKITDPEVRQLCKNILTSQQEEISQMRGILERIDQ